MEHKVKLRGLTTSPSDYDCPDGDLAVSHNLIQEDEALRPILPPKAVMQLQPGERILCIHSTAQYTHYIVSDGMCRFVWIDAADNSRHDLMADTTISSASALHTSSTSIVMLNTTTDATPIGNTVCLATSSGLQYYLWTSRNGTPGYIHLNGQLPELRLSFGLECQFKSTPFTFNNGEDTIPMSKLSSDTSTRLTNAVLSRVNVLLAQDVAEKGLFAAPFFVRYAFRLYDGSLTMHSAPILMIPNTGTPLAIGTFREVDGEHEFYGSVRTPACKLDYATCSGITQLQQYSDIIRSVDIFVSAPISAYDPNGKIESFSQWTDIHDWGIYGMGDDFVAKYNTLSLSSVGSTLKQHCKRDTMETIRAYYGHTLPEYSAGSSNGYIATIPRKDNSTINDAIRNCSNFYFIKSIELQDLATQRTAIDLEKDILPTLVNHEAMTDDYDSHDTKMPIYTYEYNNRLMMYGIVKHLFSGYMGQPFAETELTNLQFYPSLTANVGGYVGAVTDNEYSYRACIKIERVLTYIKRDGRDMVVEESPKSRIGNNIANYVLISSTPNNTPAVRIPYFYHPDSNAYKVELYGSRRNGTMYRIVLPLKPHDFLNGSFYFNSFEEQYIESVSSIAPTTDSNGYVLPNKLYVSEVNNPFYFPAKSIVTVGSGIIMGVATAAQALSQGQFGSFPLYALATDGVWALSVGSSGTIQAVQPITRDVCTNHASILQLDGSVLFATSRGLMLISGSTVRCISEPLIGEHFSPEAVQAFDHLTRQTIGTGSDILPSVPFTTFIQHCNVAYDYLNQHVWVFNSQYPYAYVFSTRSLCWATADSNLSYPLNSYPECLVVDNSGIVRNVAETDADTIKCHFVTRPLKLGDADTVKTVRNVALRGMAASEFSTALHGSNQTDTYQYLTSSKSHIITRHCGQPLKYHIVSGFAILPAKSSLSYVQLTATTREQHKLH